MAIFADASKFHKVKVTEAPVFNATHKPGGAVPNSGIYECIRCKKEVTCNKGDPFPPQNKHQHGINCTNVEWKLVAKTETD